ncbi:MAG: hypothetical protein PHN37_03165 [Candidatus Pacebacteria bacterium]|nr:hypothetical protein [Candidatus Paceibacterota bacterium]
MQLIFLFLFIISGLGTMYFVWKKIPILAELPIRQRERRKIKIKNYLPKISFEKTLHKTLSLARILILRVERKISHWLQNIRTAKRKKEKDNYWEQLKK